MARGYSDYNGFGWFSFGNLVINYAHHRATTIFLNGELIWERA